jgi:hypothetical protein
LTLHATNARKAAQNNFAQNTVFTFPPRLV